MKSESVNRSVISDSFVTPCTVARQPPLSMEFSRQEYWGGGFRMGNTCIPVADSFRYMAKPIQYCKVKKNKILAYFVVRDH